MFIFSLTVGAVNDDENYFKNGTLENADIIEMGTIVEGNAPELSISTDAKNGKYSLLVKHAMLTTLKTKTILTASLKLLTESKNAQHTAEIYIDISALHE